MRIFGKLAKLPISAKYLSFHTAKTRLGHSLHCKECLAERDASLGLRGAPSGRGQLSGIPSLSRADLLDRWRQDWGKEPPKYVSRRLLELSAAWYLQCRAFGGPDRELRRLLRGTAGSDASKPTIKPGTRLVREWNGRTHHIEVLDKGFRWNDRTYRSLSSIAKAITGSHWSGPRFFGLS